MNDEYVLKPFEENEIPIDQGILDLQNRLGLPDDFFKRLLYEDDWSFIIKLHALIEAVCGSLIIHHLDEPGLRSIVSRLELSNKTYGKLAFLKAFELIEEEERRFITALSEIRNEFVHNVQNCSASLEKIVGDMSSKELKQFALSFSPQAIMVQKLTRIVTEDTSKFTDEAKADFELLEQEVAEGTNTNFLMNRAKENPKFLIWYAAHYMLSNIEISVIMSNELQREKAGRIIAKEIEEEDSSMDGHILEPA
jgi:hypothetical protein